MSGRTIKRLERQGRLETRTADEIAHDEGKRRPLTTDHVIGWRVWLGKAACRKAGVPVRPVDALLNSKELKYEAELKKWNSHPEFRVERDDKVGTADIIEIRSGKRVAQYTTIFGQPGDDVHRHDDGR
jgi:hypothetical protein